MITQPGGSTADPGRDYGQVRQIAAVPRRDTRVIVECRSAPRYPASLVPSITRVRLSPQGADATLLNISASGILVECSNRVRLGTAVTVAFDGTFSPSSIPSRVTRSSVATVDKNGVLRYHVGIAFNKPITTPITLEEAPATANPHPATPLQPQGTPPVSAVISNRW